MVLGPISPHICLLFIVCALLYFVLFHIVVTACDCLSFTGLNFSGPFMIGTSESCLKIFIYQIIGRIFSLIAILFFSNLSN